MSMLTVSSRVQGDLRNKHTNILLLGLDTFRIAVSSAVETVCKKSAAPWGSADRCAAPARPEDRSVTIGLARTLGVGELVELVDVGLGNHDVDGREHE